MTTMKMHHIVDDLAISEGIYGLVGRIERAAAIVSKTLKVWAVRSKDRRQLAGLSDRMLADIGLNRVDVSVEINKFFWQR
ncbi:MAG: DUF1127 domain-containing protein [Gammaproteobacteria bacterium]|nr:DUF1127 domain-containing protein [Gammaproteobacteria bacterium]